MVVGPQERGGPQWALGPQDNKNKKYNKNNDKNNDMINKYYNI